METETDRFIPGENSASDHASGTITGTAVLTVDACLAGGADGADGALRAPNGTSLVQTSGDGTDVTLALSDVRFRLDEITPGDLVRVLGVGDDDVEEHWNAVVTGTLHADPARHKPDTLEVCFIELRHAGISSFRVCTDEIDIATVELHVPVDEASLRSVAEGWKQLGYVPLDEDDLWKHGEDIAPEYAMPYLSEDYCAMIRDLYGDGSCARLVGEESDDSEWDPDCDFIVPDDLGDEFTEAAEESEFVRETHAAVRAMSERYVIGDNARQRDVRNFLNALHYKYST